MDVEVKHSLPGRRAVKLVQHDSVGIECLLDGARNKLHGSQHSITGRQIQIKQVFGRIPRHNERVPGGLRHDVHERKRRVIFVNFVGGNFAAENLCENVVVVVSHSTLDWCAESRQTLMVTSVKCRLANVGYCPTKAILTARQLMRC